MGVSILREYFQGKKILNQIRGLFRLKINASHSNKLIPYVLYWTYPHSQVPKTVFFTCWNVLRVFNVGMRAFTKLCASNAVTNATLTEKSTTCHIIFFRLEI